MAKKPEGPDKPSGRAGVYQSMLERLEGVMGAVEWLKTDQAKKGVYRQMGDLEGLTVSLEKLWVGLEELWKRAERSLGGNPETEGSPYGEAGELEGLFQQVDAAVRELTGDRVVVKTEQVHHIQAAVRRMEGVVRERMGVLKAE